MSGHVLMAYATRAGSTAEVAGRVAERLCARGFAGEARPVGEVADLSGWDAVVLGSATYYASWMPAMVDFVTAHRAELARMPIAMFSLHMLNQGDSPEARTARAAYTAPARAHITPVDEAFFAGRVDPSRLSLVDRLAVRLVGSPVGDLRDWPRIEAWADALPSKLFSA